VGAFGGAAGVVPAALTVLVVAAVDEDFGVAARFFASFFVAVAFFFAAAFVPVAFFARAFVPDDFFAAGVGPATGSGTAAVTASEASDGTIGSAPMSGVERRLARSPDARAAPAARAP
jgi:hypothetical protein